MKNTYDPRLSVWLENSEVRSRLEASEGRIRKSFGVLFSGYNLKAEDVLNEVVHVKQYEGTVSVHSISFYTFCEHHFAPFYGTAEVVYEPDRIITGLGKIVRLVRDVHARRLQIQEIMTRDIALDIMRVLKARGVFVKTTAKHLCICSRGPSDDNAESTVIYACGTLKTKNDSLA